MKTKKKRVVKSQKEMTILVQKSLSKRFGMLTVLKKGKDNKKYGKIVVCVCDCGNIKSIRLTKILRGETVSCGCFRRNRMGNLKRKHGMSNTSIYGLWSKMISRCNSVKNRAYKDYGGRGIKVCKRWLKFENFLKDMGERPRGKSLDRINNNKGYSTKNCRWSNQIEQCNNTRKNVFVTYQGKTLTLKQWSREVNMGYGTIQSRITNRGWTVEQALTIPPMYKLKRKPNEN